MKNLRVCALAASVLMALPTVSLAQGKVAEVQVAPAAITLHAGTAQRLVAVAYDAGGNVLTTVRYRWSSNNLNVARVDSTGTVTAVAPGSAVIHAVAEGSGRPARRGEAVVTVRRAP